MEASVCRDGRLPSFVNRKLPHQDKFPGLQMSRRDRRTLYHASKCRGRWDPQLGFIRWSKRNFKKCHDEFVRRFMETGRL